MFVAIDRTSKFAFAELYERATRRVAGNFLRRLIEAVPYRIHTVLTDNGTHSTDPVIIPLFKGFDNWTSRSLLPLHSQFLGWRDAANRHVGSFIVVCP